MRALMIVVTLALLAGCPSSLSLTGTWSGVIEDGIWGTGTLEVEIVQHENVISGVWQAWFPEAEFEMAGAISGSAEDGSFSAILSPSDSSYCAMSVVGSWEGDALDATYVAVDCSESDVGTIALER